VLREGSGVLTCKLVVSVIVSGLDDLVQFGD
jgi:hypothetical protein